MIPPPADRESGAQALMVKALGRGGHGGCSCCGR